MALSYREDKDNMGGVYTPAAPHVRAESRVYIFSSNSLICGCNIPGFLSATCEHMNLCTPYKLQHFYLQFPTSNSPIYQIFLFSFKFCPFLCIVILCIHLYIHIFLSTRRPVHGMLLFCMFSGMSTGYRTTSLRVPLWGTVPLPLPAFLNDWGSLSDAVALKLFLGQFGMPIGNPQLPYADLNLNFYKV